MPTEHAPSLQSSSQKPRPVCAITGGSSGIGLATAQRFATGGFALSICGRDTTRLANAAANLPAAQMHTVPCDVSDPEQARHFIQETLDRWGRLDVLVHCAAVAPLALLTELDPRDFEAAIDINIRGWFHATQATWRHFLQRGAGGTIVSVSSLAAIDPFPGFAVYGATKAWEDLMIQALAAEGKPHGIRLFSIRPGAVDTPLLEGLFPNFPHAERLAPTDVAALIWEVCQPPFRYSSGQLLAIQR